MEVYGLQGVEAVPGLRTLLAANNRFETAADLQPLRACRCITTIDLRNNKLDSEEGLVQLLQVLSFSGGWLGPYVELHTCWQGLSTCVEGEQSL